MNFSEIKDDFLKEADIRRREMALNIEKAELEALKQKKQIDENLDAMRTAKEEFLADLEKLKETGENEWESITEAFDKKYRKDDLVDEVTQKAKEYSEKTKRFLSGFGNKVSDFYHKSIEDMKKTSEPAETKEDEEKTKSE